MGSLVNVSVKVPEELRKLMRRVDVNWSEYLRGVIEEKVRAEAAKVAVGRLQKVRSRARKTPTEELVRWIRLDRERSLG
ncbi:MAG: hypothetical protein QXE79_05960 [Candidatus Bathyarchaeia archaeon]